MTTPDPKELTPVQLAIVRFVYSHFRESHSVPSYREIMTRFDYASTNAVTRHLKNLEKLGWLEFTYDKGTERLSRGYKLPALVKAITTAADAVLAVLK